MFKLLKKFFGHKTTGSIMVAKRTRFYTIQPHKTYHRDRFCSYLKQHTHSQSYTQFLQFEPNNVSESIEWRGKTLTSCPRCGR